MSVYTLRKLYQAGRLIPFIGAGVSMSVDWVEGGVQKRGPSWRELVDQAAQQLGFANPDLLRVRGTDLQILEYFKLRNAGQFAKLTNWLVRNMRPDDSDLTRSAIHKALAALKGCRLMYTTNYDDLIERALRIHGREVHVVVVEDHMGSTSRDCEVVKFHGDWDHPDAMLSESDYERRLKLTTAMDYRLHSDLLRRAVLFLGYSFRDSNVAYLFRLVNEQFASLPLSSSGRRAYIVTPEPSSFEVQLFEDRNIEVIPVSSDNHALDIAELLTEIGS